MKICTAILLGFLAINVALTAEPILGFKSFLIGSDITLLKDDNRFLCSPGGAAGADTSCSGGAGETIAGETINFISLKYYKNK